MGQALLQSLPPEIRLQILEQLPLGSLLRIQGLSRSLYKDVDRLFHTPTYVLGVLQRIHMKVIQDHKSALIQYLDSSRMACDHLIHNILTLVKLMKFVVNTRTCLELFSNKYSRFNKEISPTGLLSPSRALIFDIVLHCQSATSQMQNERATLWTLEMTKLLYPPAEYQYLAV